jgi:CAAX prenyl protease-like protein
LLAFVLPLGLYLAIGAFEPRFGSSVAETREQQSSNLAEANTPNGSPSDAELARRYIAFNLAKFLTVGASILFFLPTYRRCLPGSADHWGWIVGVGGAAIWIGLCALGWEAKMGEAIGLGWLRQDARSQFNPFQQIEQASWRALFLTSRSGLLLLVVPLAEEVFLRGFLLRAVQSADWSKVDWKQIGWPALICGSLYGVITHPNEAIAALVWFSLISWLMVKTGKFWNCVLAHAVTNGLLGLYVIFFQRWELW